MPRGVYPRTVEHRRKIGDATRGRKNLPRSEEYKQKISTRMSGNKNPNWGKQLSEEHRRKISDARKGKKHSLTTRRKISMALRGKRNPFWGKSPTVETRRKMSNALKGENNPHWKGGIKSIKEKIRTTDRYKKWRYNVFLRDKFTCQKCGNDIGGNLEAHHKKSFGTLTIEAKRHLLLFDWYSACILYAPLWDLDNGITLCRECHQQINNRRR